MKHIWLYLSRSDIETERQQCEQEGRDLTSVQDEFDRVLALDLEDPSSQPAAQALLDRTLDLPLRADYKFQEPSDLEGIRAARPANGPRLPALSLSDAELEDRVYGAWTGRCIGCLLGKPVEGWRRDRVTGYLKDLDRWPLDDFFRWNVAPEVREKYQLSERNCFVDQVSAMPEDDDTNYTTTGLAILKRFGRDFTPENVASFWMSDIPILHTCTAERVAYRNFCRLVPPPASASHRNPYREWIGAQIRADFWGYAAPGNPELAAEMAWRDACVSHVKNGIYGEMWAAALIATCFVARDMRTALEAALSLVPPRSRLAEALRHVFSLHDRGLEWEAARDELEKSYGHYSWVHTINNAAVVAAALLWGEKDYTRTIGLAVQGGWDTDCNGATAGSAFGAMHGTEALPGHWVRPLDDLVRSMVMGFDGSRLSGLAESTLRFALGS